MLRVSEKNVNHQTAYLLKQESDNKVTSCSTILYQTAVIEENGINYFFIYDPIMRPIRESYDYLNNYIKDKTLNTKIVHLYALKTLYSFESIIGKMLKDFNATDIVFFKDFLLGIYRPGDTIEFEDISERKPQTVNMYLSVYRDYLKFMGVKNHHLMATGNIKSHYFSSIDNSSQFSTNYKANLRILRRNEVPKYISVEDFKSILHYIRQNYTLRDECIVRLMYETGMRLGEVLGITNEDIVSEKIDGKWCNCVYIRNRITDKRYQQAKTVLTPASVKTYKTKAYTTLNSGFQIVFITDDLRELLEEYIEEAHEFAMDHYGKRYCNSVAADSVLGEKNNFYIFINHYGSRLSNVVWNKTLRKIFNDAGIQVDNKVKENNLSHRFRHGFAMFQVQYRHMDVLELSRLMRHQSVLSTMKYYRPTTSDKLKLKRSYTEDLYSKIPELR